MAIIFAFSGCASNNNEKDGQGEQPEANDLLSQIKERGYIVIATAGNWSPWTYHDENGKLTGLDVEIGKRLAEELGVDVKFEETDWDSILSGIESGKYDIACNGVGYTDKRAEKYNFSSPYVYTHKVLVVRLDNDEIKSVEDLLKFPFKHAFNAEEYSNYEAAEAYVIRAKELLGVEIKPY